MLLCLYVFGDVFSPGCLGLCLFWFSWGCCIPIFPPGLSCTHCLHICVVCCVFCVYGPSLFSRGVFRDVLVNSRSPRRYSQISSKPIRSAFGSFSVSSSIFRLPHFLCEAPISHAIGTPPLPLLHRIADPYLFALFMFSVLFICIQFMHIFPFSH